MVQLHSVGGNAETSYGIYVSKALIEATGWKTSDSLRITAIDDNLILVTLEEMPIQDWIELYDTATAQKTVDEMSPADLVRLLNTTEGKDGRRPSTVTSLSPLGDSGYRILVTNAAKRLRLPLGTDVHRRASSGVMLLIATPTVSKELAERVKNVLKVRGAQVLE